MANLTTTALGRLLPPGLAVSKSGQTGLILEALGDALDRPREFLRAVQDEALPATASETIDQWLDLLGLVVPSGTSLADKRTIASDALAAIGGQSLEYLQARVQAVFPNVYLDESDASTDGTAGIGEVGDAEAGPGSDYTFFYYVRGFYPLARDFARIASILGRTAPLHLAPVYEARSVYDGDVARCGIGSTGREITGRTETAYTPTDGQIARCGAGVCGLEITGRSA